VTFDRRTFGLTFGTMTFGKMAFVRTIVKIFGRIFCILTFITMSLRRTRFGRMSFGSVTFGRMTLGSMHWASLIIPSLILSNTIVLSVKLLVAFCLLVV
jgi:hypothetical protein